MKMDKVIMREKGNKNDMCGRCYARQRGGERGIKMHTRISLSLYPFILLPLYFKLS
jgi:hypothetical protein